MVGRARTMAALGTEVIPLAKAMATSSRELLFRLATATAAPYSGRHHVYSPARPNGRAALGIGKFARIWRGVRRLRSTIMNKRLAVVSIVIASLVSRALADAPALGGARAGRHQTHRHACRRGQHHRRRHR